MIANQPVSPMLTRCLVFVVASSTLFSSAPRAQQRAPAPCDQYEAAVRANPNNVDAAASFGRCSVRDYEMVAPSGDSSRLAFRSSWAAALRAVRHAVELDPSDSRAYRPLFDILFAESRDGCSFITSICTHVAANLRDGDSVITTPRLVRLDGPGIDTYDEVIRASQAGNRPNLLEARTLAERWASVAANDPRPHEYLGRARLRLGDPLSATAALERAALLGTAASRRNLFWYRIEALVKSDRGVDARRVLDEAEDDTGRDTTRLASFTLAAFRALVGQHRPPQTDSTRAGLLRARLDSLMRNRAPAPPPEPAFSQLLLAGDTAAARRVLARMDSALDVRNGAMRFAQVGRTHLGSAEHHLALGDTAGAEALLAEVEQVLNSRRFQFIVVPTYDGGPPWLGRAWLLAGDLAAARRRFSDAARMYRRIIGLWGGGDPELEPFVREARARLASLPAR